MHNDSCLAVKHGRIYGCVHAHAGGPVSQQHAPWRNRLFMLKALPAAAALVFAPPGWSIDGAAGLPQNGTVFSGAATGSVSGNQLTINQSTARAVIDWSSFNIDAGKAVQFIQPGTASAVLNRVTGDANASQIMGSLSANGTVMLMNPNGVMFGTNSVVNVASLIATTGNIDVNHFINTGGARITGATGSINNKGTLTAQGAGLVALVAPSVTNQGSIVATGGTISLSGSTAATVSLNAGLYEFVVPAGASGVAVGNEAGGSLNGATILLGVGDAADLLSGVINLEGVQQASNAIRVNAHSVQLKSALQAPAVTGSSATINVSGAGRIQDGVNIVKSGGAVNVAAGTYVQPATLKIDRSLTLGGAGQGATIIDAQGVTNYGIQVTGDNVTLKDFTLYGPSADVASSYGIKVAPSGGTPARLHDFSISNVTIRGSGRAELDLNGVVGALIDHVTADGAPVGNAAGSTAGAGIQITDSANVTISNSTTRNNTWGGLALYQANRSHDQQVNNITVTGNNTFNEFNPVYLQDESATRDFGTLSIAGFDHAVRNGSSTNSNFQYTWLQASRQSAFDFAVNLESSASSYVQGWNGTEATQNFRVGTGHLLAGGDQAMAIGAAVGAAGAGASVDVYAGTYAEQLVLNKTGLTLTGHEGAKLLVPDAAEVNGIAVAANNVTVTGMEIAGPVTQSYLTYAWGNNRSRGIAVGNGITGFTLNNNNIHDVRNGILIDGRNTGSVTGNRIENTKSAISVQYTDGTGIAMSGNTQGPIGNEWGLNLHLNGHMAGSNPDPVSNSTPIAAAPTLAWQQALLALSSANSGWGVQDQGYTSSNRTQANVATTGAGNNQGSLLTPLDTIQGGIDAVVTGGVVHVAGGTYIQPATLTINKSLTLSGAGQDATVIDARAILNNYGIKVSADNVSLKGFTLYGPSANVAASYGIKVAPVGDASARLHNFSISNVTSRGAGRAELDLNGVDGAVIDHVIANGAPVGNDAGSTAGAGIQITDSANVTISNSTTRNNIWGGLALYQSNRYYNQQTSNITVAANNQFTELNPVFMQDESASQNFGAFNISGFDFAVRNSALTDNNDQYTWLQASRQQAIDYAVNLNSAGSSYVQGWNGALPTQDFQVGVGSLAGGGTRALLVAAALDHAGAGASIRIAAGTYAENVVVNNPYNLYFNGSTVHGLTLNAGAAGSGLAGAVTADTASGILLNAPVRLLGDTTLATLGADITLNGDIQNAGATAYGLRLIAGTGGTRGNVHMVTGGTAANALGSFEVSSNQFSLLDTLWVKGYKIDALGSVALSNHTLRGQDSSAANTLNAGGDITGATVSQGSVVITSSGNIAANVTASDVAISAGGDISGTTNSLGAVQMTSGGDISGSVSGSTVVVQAQGDLNLAVVASSSASLAGDTVVVNVVAPVVAVAAVGDAQVSGSSSQMTVNAPSGSVSGSFGQVTNSGGGLVNVNGKPQGNAQLSSNSDNSRVMPAGTALADNVAGDEIQGVQLAQAGILMAQSGEGGIILMSPGAAGEALSNGQSVELDLSPRNSPAESSSGKSSGEKESDRE